MQLFIAKQYFNFPRRQNYIAILNENNQHQGFTSLVFMYSVRHYAISDEIWTYLQLY
jgi:hypothetical protein